MAVAVSVHHRYTAAVVAVTRSRDRVELVAHRIYKPSAAEPLDLEQTLEATLRDWGERMPVQEIVCDPWQMPRSIATLKAAGLPIREFPQTNRWMYKHAIRGRQNGNPGRDGCKVVARTLS